MNAIEDEKLIDSEKAALSVEGWRSREAESNKDKNTHYDSYDSEGDSKEDEETRGSYYRLDEASDENVEIEVEEGEDSDEDLLENGERNVEKTTLDEDLHYDNNTRATKAPLFFEAIRATTSGVCYFLGCQLLECI